MRARELIEKLKRRPDAEVVMEYDGNYARVDRVRWGLWHKDLCDFVPEGHLEEDRLDVGWEEAVEVR